MGLIGFIGFGVGGVTGFRVDRAYRVHRGFIAVYRASG